MIRKSWWHHIQLFFVGTLIVVLLQGSYAHLQPLPQRQQSAGVPPTCHTVQHELGESCIPNQPQRVIVMDQESLEILVALGLKPIATTRANRVGVKTPILQTRIDMSAIADLGKDGQPNLEKIVQLNPDLIVGMFISPQVYSLLSQIAPTISVKYSQTAWKKTLQEVAQIFNATSQANELLTAYQQRLKRMRSQITQSIGSLKFTAMRFYTDAHLTQFLNQNSFTVNVLEELGVLAIPEIQRQQQQVPNSDWGYVNISLERVDWLDADVMFIALDPGAEESLRLYANSPLWQTIPVVKQQRVYPVDSGYWIFGNILSANAILDDVSKYLNNQNN